MTDAHDWNEHRFKWPVCNRCGIVRRRDGTNKPCPGKVRVVLRAAPAGKTADELNCDITRRAMRVIHQSDGTGTESYPNFESPEATDEELAKWWGYALDNNVREVTITRQQLHALLGTIRYLLAALAESALPGQQDGDVSAGDDEIVGSFNTAEEAVAFLRRPSKADELLRELVELRDQAEKAQMMIEGHDIKAIAAWRDRWADAFAKARAYLEGSAHGG